MSTHCAFFTAIEDFINPTLTSPSINSDFSSIIAGDIKMEDASKLGTSCVILPNVNIGFGSSVSACTIVSKDGPKSRHFKIYGYRDIEAIKNLIKKYPQTQK